MTLLRPSETAATEKTPKPRRGEFRRDIEGLRAIAVLAVLVYHLKSGVLPGGFIGVDVFFVISGFLITSHLVREHRATGRISLSRFYARRALRLIPAATLVLLGTASATVLFVPRVLWQQFGGDIGAAAVYIVNWVFAGRSIDYLAEDAAASPVQHFWSLAVEEQFYLLWPLLIIVAGVIAIQLKTRYRLTVGTVAMIVVVISLAWTLLAAQSQGASIYFTTTTRLWELAIGAATAIAFPWLRDRMPKAARFWLAYIGLIGLLASLVLLRDENLWPSVLTTIPVVATAFVILGGGSSERSLPERGLSVAPLVWVGGISYSLYLWHWPLITIAKYVRPSLSYSDLILIAEAAVVLAWLTHLLVENPVRFSRWMRARARNGLILGLVCALVSAAAGGVLWIAGAQQVLAPPASSAGSVKAVGSGILSSDISQTPLKLLTANPAWVVPQPMSATDDVPHFPDGANCEQNQLASAVIMCIYGAKSAKPVMVAVGDSKIEQWFPALNALAVSEHYRLVTLFKSACPLSEAPILISGQRVPSCDAWNIAARKEIAKLKPTVIFTSQVRAVAVSNDGDDSPSAQRESMIDGLASQYADFRQSGIRVAVVSDNPSPAAGFRVYECVAEHPDAVAACSFARDASSSASAQKEVVERDHGSIIDASSHLKKGSDPGLVFVDMTDAICPPQLGNCPAVIGNVDVYRQGSHLTVTYVSTMTKRFEHVVEKANLVER
ncbi:MAG TPA: acyltransferase family protein [Galbitalea sp.]